MLERVTAIIPNWNTADLTLRCVEALTADGLDPRRIVVVENGSSDDSGEVLRRSLPECTILELAENVGYSRAMNAGAAAVPGDVYLLMNNDAFVRRPGSIARLVEALADPSVGLAVPRLVNPDLSLQPSVVPQSSPLVELVRASGLSRFVPDRWAPRFSTHWSHDSSRDIMAATGAVMAVSGETWERLGGMDERIYMYAEDLDLCWRVRELGKRVRFCSESEFVHLGNSSGSKQWTDARRAQLIGASEAALIRRHLSPLTGRLTLGFLLAGLAVRWFGFKLVRRQLEAAILAGALRGYVSGPPARL